MLGLLAGAKQAAYLAEADLLAISHLSTWLTLQVVPGLMLLPLTLSLLLTCPVPKYVFSDPVINRL